MSPCDAIFIKACVLSLASNIHQDAYLTKAEQWLASFGDITLSAVHTNQQIGVEAHSPTNSASSLGIYYNKIVLLAFDQPIDYLKWVQLTKDFEHKQHRHNYEKPVVTLDIDVVAIRLAHRGLSAEKLVDEKGDNFLCLADKDSGWLGVARRFPLACYDQQGIEELSQKADLPLIKHS